MNNDGARQPRRKPFNLFYPVVLVDGVLFLFTATAYAVMTYRQDRWDLGAVVEHDPSFNDFIARHGQTCLLTELAVLAVATVGMMAVEQWRSGRSG